LKLTNKEVERAGGLQRSFCAFKRPSDRWEWKWAYVCRIQFLIVFNVTPRGELCAFP
jgi:hypothetical protein